MEKTNIERVLSNTTLFAQKTYLSIEEAAAYLCMSKSTLYKHTSTSNIAFYKPNGKLIVFKIGDLDAWITKKRVPSNDELNFANLDCVPNYPKTNIVSKQNSSTNLKKAI